MGFVLCILQKDDVYRSASGITWGVNHDYSSQNCELTNYSRQCFPNTGHGYIGELVEGVVSRPCNPGVSSTMAHVTASRRVCRSQAPQEGCVQPVS